MPSFSNDVPYQSHTVAPPASHHNHNHPRPSVESPQGKPHDKSPVGNTFLWTNWPNGDASHRDTHPSDRQLLTNLKDGSAYSLNGGPRSSVSSHTREPPHSKDGSMYSLGNASARDPRDTTPRPSTTLDRDITRKSLDAGAGSATASVSSQQPMGTTSMSSRSLNGKPTVNGDHHPRPSVDQLALSDGVGNNASVPPQTEHAGRLSPETGRLSPSTTSAHRYSSSGIDGPSNSSNPPPLQQQQQQPQQDQTSLRHRHTLQVPRSASARRSSEDAAYSSGRLSPTGGIRRTSLSLARRTTRTNHSNSFPNEANPDEETSRYAEAIKQRRASRKRRRDDDDDEHVIVGTKVDQNHVNWVTAYNMLTGIRFTVSRINAKMDRELTMADFEAKHKFSFDMYARDLFFSFYLFLFLLLSMPPSLCDFDSDTVTLVPGMS